MSWDWKDHFLNSSCKNHQAEAWNSRPTICNFRSKLIARLKFYEAPRFLNQLVIYIIEFQKQLFTVQHLFSTWTLYIDLVTITIFTVHTSQIFLTIIFVYQMQAEICQIDCILTNMLNRLQYILDRTGERGYKLPFCICDDKAFECPLRVAKIS